MKIWNWGLLVYKCYLKLGKDEIIQGETVELEDEYVEDWPLSNSS